MSLNFAPVESTNLKTVGYSTDEEALFITFRSGGVYVYRDVPPEIAEELLSAESKGQYFHQYIKKGGYTYERIG